MSTWHMTLGPNLREVGDLVFEVSTNAGRAFIVPTAGLASSSSIGPATSVLAAVFAASTRLLRSRATSVCTWLRAEPM
jgi:hypothetical protein